MSKHKRPFVIEDSDNESVYEEADEATKNELAHEDEEIVKEKTSKKPKSEKTTVAQKNGDSETYFMVTYLT
ncbi:hypothetical protein BGZ46_000802 [Entomortierella lignicola]|nr:hypothetical protein BGZ46_000802 [Entomortierella lignicola]